MSTVIAKNVQVGTSGTANQNFTLYQPASPDGTVRLGVGNTGATTLDAVTVTNAGNVSVTSLSVNTITPVSGSLTVSSTGQFVPAVGTTEQRPTPVQGGLRFNTTTTQFEGYNGTAWAGLGGGGGVTTANISQTVLTATWTTTSLVYIDVTGMSVTITPSSATSKILILADVSIGPNPGNGSLYLRFARNGSALPYLGDAATGRVQAMSNFYTGDSAGTGGGGGSTKIYLDSPATTSTVTYSLQARGSTTTPGFINRTQADRASTNFDSRTASSITVIEMRQ